jgi:hypothetical protein
VLLNPPFHSAMNQGGLEIFWRTIRIQGIESLPSSAAFFTSGLLLGDLDPWACTAGSLCMFAPLLKRRYPKCRTLVARFIYPPKELA